MRIGLYGGSFDPIHHGHLIISRAVAEAARLDRVVFLPSANPPHKGGKPMADAGHRAAMVKLAITGDPLFEFSDVDLRHGPSFTIDTVRHFRQVFGSAAELHWIIGADSLAELATWRQVGELVDSCQITTAARPGWEAIDWHTLAGALEPERVEKVKRGVVCSPHIDISATDVRRRVASGQSIRYLVPEPVRVYIEQNALYVRSSN
jgi:nicotinate-nucleotide adenylyltransferase